MASSTLVSPVEFSPFQAAPLWRRPTPTPAGAGTEGNTTADVPPVVVREESADEQEEPPAVRQDAVAEPTERANQQPDEQIMTEPKVEKPDGDQEQESKIDAEVFPDASQAELLNETATDPAPWRTQAAKSDSPQTTTAASTALASGNWKLCDTEAGADYIPCLDNVEFIRKLQHDEHYEHRERHCPEEPPTCLVPMPNGYRSPIRWPKSRDQVLLSVLMHEFSSYLLQTWFVHFGVLLVQIWYSNVPHTQLVEFKGHQNWVNVSGEHLVFPGGGTQFKYGALHYIDFIQEVTLTAKIILEYCY
jgi:hypothetical protein